MKQISLTKYYDNNKELIGKTVKDISYMENNDMDNSYLIITFTDDTYIYLCSKHSDEDYDDIILTNDYAVPLKCYASPPGNVYHNNGEGFHFRYYPYIEEQIRCGLIEPEREKSIELVRSAERAQEERELKEYYRLKEKYGNK